MNQWDRTKVDSEEHRLSWQGSEGRSPARTQHRKRLCMNAALFSWCCTTNPSAAPAVQKEKLSAGQWDEHEGGNLTSKKVASQNHTGETAVNILGLVLVGSRWRLRYCKSSWWNALTWRILPLTSDRTTEKSCRCLFRYLEVSWFWSKRTTALVSRMCAMAWHMYMISVGFYRLDKWFSSQEATGQLDLDAWQIVAAVCLATFL